jgi:hypothetical protein
MKYEIGDLVFDTMFESGFHTYRFELILCLDKDGVFNTKTYWTDDIYGYDEISLVAENTSYLLSRGFRP